ncbi:hypothetical protein TeGR_g436, partial [Tetraparma gracilis]
YFFGQILGLALRNRVGLSELSLNMVVWRIMAGVSVGREDLYDLDSGLGQTTDILAQIGNLGVDDDESFVALFGGGIEWGEGMGGGRVEGVKEAAEMACRLRRMAFLDIAAQVQAIYCGLVSVVPACGLVLYDSGQLQELFRSGGLGKGRVGGVGGVGGGE